MKHCLRLFATLLLLQLLALAVAAQETPLEDAAEAGDVAKLKEILDQAGSESKAAANHALLVSAEQGRREAVEFLLTRSADVNAGGRGLNFGLMETSPLALAIQHGHTDVAVILIKAGAKVNWGSTQDEIPLYLAIQRNDKELLGILAANGADIFRTNRAGVTAIDFAIQSGGDELAEVMLSRITNVNLKSRAGETPLHVAARLGRKDLAELLLARGAELQSSNSFGFTPLHTAVWHGRPVTAEYLLAKGARLDSFTAAGLGRLESLKNLVQTQPNGLEAVDGSGRTTLHWAAAMGQAEVVRWLLAAQTPGFVQSRDHDTPLDLAALNKHQEVVVALLAYLRTAGKDGGILTPSLHGAVKGGDKAIIEKILAAGAEVNQTDGHGTTPLYLAVEAGNTEVVDLLLAHKAQADTPTLAGDTPLKSAARNGHPEIVRLLMATTRLKQANQQRVTTPLHEAVAHRNDAVVEELLKGGASVDARDENGNTPFHIAAQHNALELMELLLAHGANVNAEDGEGNTALHYEARSGTQWDEEGGEWDANRGPKPTWVRYAGNTGNFLLDHGARAQATNALGETALHFFGKRRESGSGAISNEEGLVKLLLQHGADINARDLGGQTPLHVAALNGSDTVLQVLLTHGAEVNARDNEGRTPWLAAAGADWKRGDSPEAVTFQVLANNKADLQAMDIHGNTALHEAAKADYFRAVEALRALGLNAGATNRLGQTPLALALANNSVFSVPKLLPNGVTVDIFEAARVGDQTAIKALLTFDRQLVNLTNWFGATPLLVAAQNGHVEVAQLLLAYQASVHARDPMGRTALHLAYLNGSKPLIELLINNHADVEAKDWSGKKPADLKRPAPAAAARRRRAGELVSRYWVWLPIVVIVAATPWIWHQRRHHFVSPSPFPKP